MSSVPKIPKERENPQSSENMRQAKTLLAALSLAAAAALRKRIARGGKDAELFALRKQISRAHNVKELAITMAGGPKVWRVLPERTQEGYLLDAQAVSLWVATGKRGS